MDGSENGGAAPVAAVRHIVWDFNGTLIDDVPLVVDATNAALAAIGLAEVSHSDYQTHYTRPLEVFFERLVGRPLTDEEDARIEAVFFDHYLRHEPSVPLTAGVHEVLAEFTAMGLSQSVCSLYPHAALCTRIAELGLAHHFIRVDGLHGRGGGTKRSALAAHIMALGVPAGEVVMIGDSLDDAAAAAHAGAHCVLLDSGMHHATVLAGADVHVTATLAEALRHVVGRAELDPEVPSGAE